MAIGNPVSPLAPVGAFGPHPRLPYSAVPLPSNWELWRNFPGATQHGLVCRVESDPWPKRRANAVGEPCNMTVSWQLGAGKFCQYASGVVLMMILMLIAGVGCLLAGLLAIGFGIPVKEFSFGNTLIVTGVVGACAGLIILSMSAVVRELKDIAGRLGSGLSSNLP